MFSCLSFHVTGPILHSAPAAPLSESSQSSGSIAGLEDTTIIDSFCMPLFVFWRGRLAFDAESQKLNERFSSTFSQWRSNVSLYHSTNVSHRKYLKKVRMRFMRVEFPGCESSEWIHCPTAMMMTQIQLLFVETIQMSSLSGWEEAEHVRSVHLD